jgi:hypothetical protein
MGQDADDIMASIGEAVEEGRAGRAGAARERLTALWERIGPDADPFHRCALAHYLADLQDDPADELRWDLRALDAADTLTDERAQDYHDSLRVEAFRPSLQLNLAEDYRKLGRPDRAREHIVLARQSVGALGDDEYGRMIRAAIERVAEQVATVES